MISVNHLITTIERGGAENQLLILAREQVSMGHSVTVTPLKGKLELLSEFQSIGAYVNLDLHNRNPLIQLLLLRFKFRKSSDIVHAHLPRAELISTVIASKTQLVVSRHNAEPFFPSAPSVVSSLLSRLVTFKSAQVIAISNSVKSFLQTNNELANGSKLKIIHYGIDLEVFEQQSQKADFRGRHGISSTQFLLGTISRLTEQKDIPTLLNAFSKVVKVLPDSHLLVIGVGHLEVNLKAIAHQLNLENRVTWVGKTNEVASYLAALDVFVLTSKYEGFGLVLLEAMAAGLPIVSSDSDAALEVLGPSVGFKFPVGNQQILADKILMLSNPNLRSLESSASRSRASVFQSRNMAIEMEATYQSLLGL